MERLSGDVDVIHLPYYLTHCYVYCRQNKSESKNKSIICDMQRKKDRTWSGSCSIWQTGCRKLCVLVEWVGDTVMVGSEMQGVWGGGGRG